MPVLAGVVAGGCCVGWRGWACPFCCVVGASIGTEAAAAAPVPTPRVLDEGLVGACCVFAEGGVFAAPGLCGFGGTEGAALLPG